MAQEQLKKVFIDLDGTLLDVSKRHYKVYSEVVAKFGGQPLQKATYWDLKRKKTKWPELLPASGLPASTEQQFLEAFVPLIENPEYLRIDQLQPDALHTVTELSKHLDCYLVSLRRQEPNLLKELEWLGLRRYFTKVLSGHSETDGYDKKIELIKKELGTDRGVIIGDTEADIVAGKHLNMITVAVTSGIRDEQFLAALKPVYLVDHIGQVLNLPIFTTESKQL